MPTILLLATLETKAEEAGYLERALKDRGVEAGVIDISLGADGAIFDPAEKLARMAAVSASVRAEIETHDRSAVAAILGLGGGTGGEIILNVMRGLVFDVPKILVTTLPFDPRGAVADSSIILVPTLADIEGLNTALRQILEITASMTAGLVQHPPAQATLVPSIALTTLGATKQAGSLIIRDLRARGHEVTAFHANGFGGAALMRCARAGAFHGVIDMTVHEITRMCVAGDHVPMADRFTCTGHLPRVILPGGLNFLGLGALETIPDHYRARPHYRHSGFFTHVKLSPDEIETACHALAEALNQSSAPAVLILPMGGFSHEDRPGGMIEAPELRAIAAECLERAASGFQTMRIDAHINDPATAARAVQTLLAML